ARAAAAVTAHARSAHAAAVLRAPRYVGWLAGHEGFGTEN
ncbi:LysR family transcriptional regulator, partial [Streptomyces sp. SID3343]|nr:LysR family transcriptional regulator [Streptomyces sp. SID3343]